MDSIILLSNNPGNLRDALNQYSHTATVEAEYGDDVVSGTVETLAHHGPRAAALCPCLEENREVELEAIGLSHIDLDALGGILALLGTKPNVPSFWDLAAFVDLNGPHKLSESGASKEDLARLDAWWAWKDTNLQYPERDGSVSDVTEYIKFAANTLEAILAGREHMLEAGAKWREKNEALNASSFVGIYNDVAVRVGPTFVNHLYTPPLGYSVAANGETRTAPAKAVVGFNTMRGDITVSLADPIEGVSCRDVVQALWGGKAGGHVGIAGSPRDVCLTLDDVVKARDKVIEVIREALPPAITVDYDVRVQFEALINALLYNDPAVAIEELAEAGTLWQLIWELEACCGQMQNHWHADGKDVWDHTLDVVRSLCPGAGWRLRLAALLHDVGKPPTAAPAYGPGEFSFHKHPHVGAEMTRVICTRMGMEEEDVEYVTLLVDRHMAFVGYPEGLSEKALRKMGRKLGDVTLNFIDDLIELTLADDRSHGDGRDTDQRYAGLREALNNAIVEVRAESEPQAKELAISGKDVMSELDLKPGPQLGTILATLKKQVDNDPGLNTREDLLRIAQGLVPQT